MNTITYLSLKSAVYLKQAQVNIFSIRRNGMLAQTTNRPKIGMRWGHLGSNAFIASMLNGGAVEWANR